ncbi:segregation/condensation protein A [Corynebacterium poyangense]|uniref:Segregation and condensation protein A n=1 Tax=Corynebacterium poyangense TaxID=2684405 RepID=A0A7H0SNQ4_9CORY|nr:segregation/condensation protein A [Corynebacterium poyangense]MBZ8177725.1 segregation/condensation protein A [Corynebacterium poyangense]QNQ90179.1 segregation/condensation protein A [Corynebacterium poyangense]
MTTTENLDEPAVQPEITGFRVALHNFEGPFDLLLQLIQARRLDITDVALAEVTDEFVAYTRHLGDAADLDETTQFLLVAATLLDLKAARLVPHGEVDDEADLELLSARDLLFARLLQYRAYSQVAERFHQWQQEAPRRYPRLVAPEEKFASLLPPVYLGHTPHSFAELAAGVFRPQPPEEVAVGHIHQVAVSVPEQAGRILDILSTVGQKQWLSFHSLTSDCALSMEIIGRFLALLELYKAHAVEAHQEEALAELKVRWTGKDVDPSVVAAANWD